jgi:hypothetical protein
VPWLSQMEERLRWPKPRCCVDRLHRRVTELEQQTAEQRRQFAERDGELDAARASNRELMTRSTGHTPTGAITGPHVWPTRKGHPTRPDMPKRRGFLAGAA